MSTGISELFSDYFRIVFMLLDRLFSPKKAEIKSRKYPLFRGLHSLTIVYFEHGIRLQNEGNPNHDPIRFRFRLLRFLTRMPLPPAPRLPFVPRFFAPTCVT